MMGALLAVTLMIFLLALIFGSVAIPPAEVLRALLGQKTARPAWAEIVQLFRLPKALTAALCGAALGVSGLLMQTLFRNPLAGPFVLGISSAASLGVALVVLGGSALAGAGLTGSLGLAGAAMSGAALALVLVLLAARAVGSNMTLLVLGVMLGFLGNAIINLLTYFSAPQQIQAFIAWTFGSFGAVSRSELDILMPLVLVGLALAGAQAPALDALLVGEEAAQSLGLDLRRARLLLVLATAVLAGAVTAFAGPIGFLGIAVPHLCRSLLGTSGHRALLPACALTGAGLALLAALLAELPGSHLVLPLNAVMALLGAPVVISVILRRRNLGRAFRS